MQPAMPGRRHARSFCITPIDHPTAIEAECRVDPPAACAEIAVAELVFADEFAIAPGPQLGAEGLAVPPGEQPQEEGFHKASVARDRGTCHPHPLMSRRR